MSEAGAPPIPWNEVLANLERFYGELMTRDGSDTEAEIRDAVEADAAARTAARDYFRQAYTQCSGRDFDVSDARLLPAMNGLAAVVLEVSPVERREFVDEVLFRVVPESSYEVLADVVRLLLPVDELVDRIVDRLEHGSDRERANALAMQYHLFGRPGALELGTHRRAAIESAVERLRGSGSVGPATRAQLADFHVPEDAAS